MENKTTLLSETRRRKDAEANLGKTEEVLRLLVDAVEDYAMFVMDPNGYILTWNTGAQRLKGYSPTEIIGSHFSRFYTAEDLQRDHPRYELERAAANGKYEEEGWRIRKNGTRFWANVVITALKDESGSLRGFGKVTRDLTHKRIMLVALKQSEERFRLMVESVKDYAIFMLNPQGLVATWNLGAERMKGYRAIEIIGKHFSAFFNSEGRAAGKPEHELAEAIRHGRFEEEGWRYRKDGSRFWADVVITPVYDEDRKLLGFTKVTRDLTERKATEDELREAYAGLEARVIERTKELSKAKAHAEAAVRARDQFFSMASHELKTPLFALKLQTQIRQKNVERGNLKEFAPENLPKLCADDNRQVDRLSALVDRMLDVSRMSSGDFALNRSQVSVCELINSTVRRLAPILAQSKNEVLVVCPQSVKMNWDPVRMEQVFTNFLTNAGKYAPGKPVVIRVEPLPNDLKIDVQDFGPGISTEDCELIFEPFERAKATGDGKGLGLGLYICRRIVEAHGGKLEARSVPRQGLTFRMEFPYREEAK